MSQKQIDYLLECQRRVEDMWKGGYIRCPVHMCGGNEEQLVRLFKMIKPGDWVFSTHRNMYHYLLKGGDYTKYIRELLGEPQGSICHGFGGSMGIIDKEINFYSTGIVGGGCAIAVGVAWALKKSRIKANVFCFVGDGATDTGHFMEALRYSVSWDLPVFFVLEDNERSVDSPPRLRWGSNQTFPSTKTIEYKYKPKFPHVGNGKFVKFM